jgi:hypothetical protein
MNHAVLYNVFVCLMIAFISYTAGRALLIHEDPSGAARRLGWSWICGALLWLFAGLRLLEYFFYLRYANEFFFRADRFFFYLNEVALAGQVTMGAAFAAGLGLRRGAARTATVMTAASAATFLFFLFWNGIDATMHTAWASRHTLTAEAFRAFLPGYGLSLFLVVYAIIFTARERRSGVGGERARWALPALAALLLYAVVGVVDVRGVWGGWQLLLIRTGFLVAALATYWVAQPADASMQVVRRPSPNP